MSFIRIKKIQKHDAEKGSQEWFAVSAVGMATPQGKKLIPNPSGIEALLFETLEAAEAAIRRAGFDYEYEGKRTNVWETIPTRGTLVDMENPLIAAIPILIQRLQDREPSVVANSALALGSLKAKDALPNLIQILGYEDASVRKSVSEALARLAPGSIHSLKQAFEAARQSIQGNAPYIRLTVMSTFLEMIQMGQGQLVFQQCLPVALLGLEDESWLVRSQAAMVVAQVAALEATFWT